MITPERRAELDRICLAIIARGKVCGHTYGQHFGGGTCIAGHRGKEASVCPCRAFDDGKARDGH